MAATLKKPRLFSNKVQQKPKPQIEKNTTLLPLNLPFKQKIKSRSDFVEFNLFLCITNEL